MRLRVSGGFIREVEQTIAEIQKRLTGVRVALGPVYQGKRVYVRVMV